MCAASGRKLEVEEDGSAGAKVCTKSVQGSFGANDDIEVRELLSEIVEKAQRGAKLERCPEPRPQIYLRRLALRDCFQAHASNGNATGEACFLREWDQWSLEEGEIGLFGEFLQQRS